MRLKFVIIFLIIFKCGFSQGTYKIEGVITDKVTKAPLPGANVLYLNGQKGIATGNDGTFELRLLPGKYSLVISYLGYRNDTLFIELLTDIKLEIGLEPLVIEGKEVKIIANRSKSVESSGTGITKLKEKDISALPTILGEKDPIKILQLTPGVQGSKDGFSGIYIRGGGGPDQNLVLLDEAIIYNPVHLYGFFSIFNSDAIGDVQLTKSGMDAMYGGRLASVLEVNIRDGDFNKWRLKSSFGLLSSKITLDGPLYKEKISMLVSFRRTYIDEIIKSTDDLLNLSNKLLKNSSYYFGDINGKISFKLSGKDKITLTAFNGNDIFNFNNRDLGLTTRIYWENAMSVLNWIHSFNEKFYLKNSVSLTKYNFSFIGQYTDYQFKLQSDIKNLHYKSYINMQVDKHLMKSGIEFDRYNINPTEQNAQLSESFLEIMSENIFHSSNLAAFFSDDFEWNRFKVNAGLRFSFYMQHGPVSEITRRVNGELEDSLLYKKGEIVAFYPNIEPRLAVRYLLNDFSSLKLSYTKNAQYVHIAPVSSVSLPTDIWVPSTEKIKPQQGFQLATGYYRYLMDGVFEFSAEAYIKKFYNQIEFKSGAVDVFNNSVENKIIFGRGDSEGIEFFLKKNSGNLSGWVGYTLSGARRQFDEINDGEPFFAKYDRRHDFSIVTNYNISSNWKASFVFVYATGNAMTVPAYRYLVQGYVLNGYSEINSFRMPPYHRADISFTRTFKRRLFTSELNFSIYNLYNRSNPYYIFFKTKGNIEEYYIEVKPEMVSLFPILPSVSYNITF